MDCPIAQPVQLDESGRLAMDLNCVKCGYNLRGLDPESACPECGTAIGRSLQGDRLCFRDPDWLEALVRGMNWIVASIVISIVIGCVGMPLLGVLGAIATIAAKGNLFSVVLQTGMLMVSFIGYWWITTPDPGKSEPKDRTNARQVTRMAIVAKLLLTPAVGLAYQLPAQLYPIGIVLSVIAMIAGVVSQFAVLIYARQIALRIPSEKLARHTRIVMWGLIIPGVNIIFTIWALFLIDEYRKTLRLAAHLARETWASAPAP